MRSGPIAGKPHSEMSSCTKQFFSQANSIPPLEVWGAQPIERPKRSPFLPLAPIGLGTALVESMTSYITRLATAHSISVLDLLNHSVRTIPPHPARGSRAVLGRASLAALIAKHPGMFNGRDRRASIVRLGIQGLTGCGMLEHLTTMPLQGLFSPDLVLRDHAAWCSFCLQEWDDRGDPLYEPLLWKLEAVGVCPFHNEPLTHACNSCQAPVQHLGNLRQIGHCQACGGWLGLSPGPPSQPRAASIPRNWESYVVLQLGFLLAFFSDDTIAVLPGEFDARLRRALELRPSWRQQPWLARLDNEVVRCDGTALPSQLDALLYACVILNLDLPSLLLAGIAQAGSRCMTTLRVDQCGAGITATPVDSTSLTAGIQTQAQVR